MTRNWTHLGLGGRKLKKLSHPNVFIFSKILEKPFWMSHLMHFSIELHSSFDDKHERQKNISFYLQKIVWNGWFSDRTEKISITQNELYWKYYAYICKQLQGVLFAFFRLLVQDKSVPDNVWIRLIWKQTFALFMWKNI